MSLAETDHRVPGPGLPASDFAALRTEVLRTGVTLSDEQLLDLADGLHSLIRLRRPGRPIRRHDGWIEPEPRAFA